MLLVKTTIGLSTIHGLGLFAAEFIPKDTLIWTFQPDFDLMLSEEALERLAIPAREQVLRYCYLDNGMFILCADDARFFNASRTPNCIPDALGQHSVAARDIVAGEELTEDYDVVDDGTRLTHRYR